jgi:transcriptional regulator with XRE-family HTH domain
METGSILRQARRAAQRSQLDLALSLGVSQRHVSFVESGRSRPSRDFILNWMVEVHAPVSVRNAALLSTGYALVHGPGHSRAAVPDEETPVHRRVLETHDPMPGMVFNADWRMLRLNAGARWLFSLVMPEFLASPERSVQAWDMIAGIGHAGGLLSRMPEPWTIARRHLRQLRIEQLNRPNLKNRIDAMEASLGARFGDSLLAPPGTEPEPGLNLQFDTQHGRLSFFSVQSVFDLPQNTAPVSVRTGLWFPSNRETRAVLESHVPGVDHIDRNNAA